MLNPSLLARRLARPGLLALALTATVPVDSARAQEPQETEVQDSPPPPPPKLKPGRVRPIVRPAGDDAEAAQEPGVPPQRRGRFVKPMPAVPLGNEGRPVSSTPEVLAAPSPAEKYKETPRNGPGGTVQGPGEPPPNRPTTAVEPQPAPPVDKKAAGRSAKTVMMNFDKAELSDVINFVANWTQRNFILPERVNGKITIKSNHPIAADEVWSVFLAALDANNWALYPVGAEPNRFWKLTEKKQSARANIPTFLENGQEVPSNEQMVTKLFKLKSVEADQMRNTLNQFTSANADMQIFPPDTLIISDLGLNMRRLERLVESLDHPGGSDEIHIVQIQYGSAQEIAAKLTEVFPAQGKGAPRFGIVAEQMPGVVNQMGQPAQQAPVNPQAQASGPVTVSKIIAEDRTNKIIIISPGRSFGRVLELIKQLDVPTGESGVHVLPLQNAKAEELATTLNSLVQAATAAKHRPGSPNVVPQPPQGAAGANADAAFSGDIKATADKGTNSLVITGSAADYNNLRKVIEKLDTRRRQVFVEAVIMEVNLNDSVKVGVSEHAISQIDNLNFRGTRGAAPFAIGSELGPNSLGGISSLAQVSGFLAGLQGPPISIGTFSFPSLAIVLNALQTSNNVNVISTPTVLMTDNTEGEVTIGQNIPFRTTPKGTAGLPLNLGAAAGAAGAAGAGGLGQLTGALSGFVTPIQRQNVELRLKIKPQINDGDYVRLDVDEQTEEIASNDEELGPTTSKRTAKTQVVAKDQETVVLGGLIQDRAIRSVSKVPFLGSLPVLGWLFRSESTTKTKTNLLLFLTPYVIRDQSDYRRIFERKMAERREFVRRFADENDEEYRAVVDYSRKPGALQLVHKDIEEEMNKVENGGAGSSSERVITPRRRDAVQTTGPGEAAPPVSTPAASPVPAAPVPAAPANASPLAPPAPEPAPGAPAPGPVRPGAPTPVPQQAAPPPRP